MQSVTLPNLVASDVSNSTISGAQMKHFTIGNKCNMYNYYHVNVELIKRLIDPSIKFNLIVANQSLRHFVDPVGTYIQLYDLLKENGLIMTTGYEENK